MVRIVAQRVDQCKVTIVESGNAVSQIGCGIVLFIGLLKRSDGLSNTTIATNMIDDVLNTLGFLNSSDDIMVCSQITLCGKMSKNKMNYHYAEDIEKARNTMNEIVSELKLKYRNVQRSIFRTYSEIFLQNVSKTIFICE